MGSSNGGSNCIAAYRYHVVCESVRLCSIGLNKSHHVSTRSPLIISVSARNMQDLYVVTGLTYVSSSYIPASVTAGIVDLVSLFGVLSNSTYMCL
jgi:hypothetical protein